MDPKTKFFRNRYEIKDCEPESLWKLQGSILILVDDDQYIFANAKDYPGVFYEVPDPISQK